MKKASSALMQIHVGKESSPSTNPINHVVQHSGVMKTSVICGPDAGAQMPEPSGSRGTEGLVGPKR